MYISYLNLEGNICTTDPWAGEVGPLSGGLPEEGIYELQPEKWAVLQEDQMYTLQNKGHVYVNTGTRGVMAQPRVKALSERNVLCQGKCWELWLDQTLQILRSMLCEDHGEATRRFQIGESHFRNMAFRSNSSF